MRLLLTADVVDASEAVRLGLLDEVVATGTSRAAALNLAERIGRNGGLAVRLLKRTLRAHQTLPPAEAARVEREAFGEPAKRGFARLSHVPVVRHLLLPGHCYSY